MRWRAVLRPELPTGPSYFTLWEKKANMVEERWVGTTTPSDPGAICVLAAWEKREGDGTIELSPGPVAP